MQTIHEIAIISLSMAKEDKQDNYGDVVRRLDVIIGLLSDLLAKGKKVAEEDQMLRLRELGLKNPEIASLFGKDSDRVKKQIYNAKQKVKKKKG